MTRLLTDHFMSEFLLEHVDEFCAGCEGPLSGFDCTYETPGSLSRCRRSAKYWKMDDVLSQIMDVAEKTLLDMAKADSEAA